MVLTTSTSQLQTPSLSPSPQTAKAKDQKSKSFRSGWKKVGQYFKDQARNNSENYSTLFLSPPTPRWTQSNDFIYEVSEHDELDAQIIRKLTALNPYAAPNHPPPYSYSSALSPLSSRSPSHSMSSPARSISGPGVLQNITRHQYASDNILQSYDILVPEREATSKCGSDDGLWVVYIHGGYFADPKIDSTAFKPAIALLEDSEHQNNIAGYCSINYRLSAYDRYPQDPDTPEYTLNDARWPDEPSDILHALSHLQTNHPASRNYILVGHSVGATLAFIATLESQSNTFGLKVAPPKALLGVSGIYDFPAIHKTHPSYEFLTKNAMGKAQYPEASPALYDAATYAEKWRLEHKKRIIVLAHSKDDGLVDWDQPTEMLKVFDHQPQFDARLIELYGVHDSIWEKGTELVRAIEATIREVGAN